MREIKFRAWDKEINKMIYDAEMGFNMGSCFGDVLFEVNKGKMILMQYTGLRDKNGKDIYEGDIVWSEGHRLQFTTEYQLSMGGFMFCSEGLLMGVGQHADVMEIIGNIYEGILTKYENPDILKLCQKELKVFKKDINTAKKLSRK